MADMDLASHSAHVPSYLVRLPGIPVPGIPVPKCFPTRRSAKRNPVACSGIKQSSSTGLPVLLACLVCTRLVQLSKQKWCAEPVWWRRCEAANAAMKASDRALPDCPWQTQSAHGTFQLHCGEMQVLEEHYGGRKLSEVRHGVSVSQGPQLAHLQ